MLKIFSSKNKPTQTSLPWFNRLTSGLSKTRHHFTEQLSHLFLGKKHIDDALLESLETLLITADFGINTAQKILQTLSKKVERKQLKDSEALQHALKEQLLELLQPCQKNFTRAQQPYVILMVGINGAGKTTTIGKLAHHFQQQGKTVMLAAGDTFRAAAVEQLQRWGERHHI